MANAREALVLRARGFRKDPTRSEAMLWQALRNRGLGEKFYRQRVIGPFVPDFVCEARALIVEIDGAVHEGEAAEARDAERERWLKAKGYSILRFSASEVETLLGSVLVRIRAAMSSASPR